MKEVIQKLEDILAALSPLKVEWQDDTARRVIDRLKKFPIKKVYAAADVDDGLFICRLFLAQSKDEFTAALKAALKGAGGGITRYRKAVASDRIQNRFSWLVCWSMFSESAESVSR